MPKWREALSFICSILQILSLLLISVMAFRFPGWIESMIFLSIMALCGLAGFLRFFLDQPELKLGLITLRVAGALSSAGIMAVAISLMFTASP